MASNFWLDQAAQIQPDQAQINAANMNALGQPMMLVDPNAPAPMPTPTPVAAPHVKHQHLTELQKYLPKAGDSGSPVTDAFTDQSNRALDDQKATLAGLNDYINQIGAKPQGTNLSPLAAYVDTLTGSNFAPVAEKMAPMSADDKDKMLFGLKNQLAQGQQKFSADQLRALTEQRTMQHQQAKMAADDAYRKDMLDVQRDRNSAQGMRAKSMQQRMGIQAGQEFEKNHIISTSKESKESLFRASSILDNPNKPVTSQDLALSYNDFINAVAKGGAATEGKIHREMPDSWIQKWNEFKGKIKPGDDVDMRATPEGRWLIDQLKENVRTVHMDLDHAITRQAKMIGDNYSAIDNPYVTNTLMTKRAAYTDRYGATQEKPDHGPSTQTTGKVRVMRNGQVGELDRSDLAEALADGWKEVK